MTGERTLHAWARGWDAADAVAARMRIEAVLKSVQAPIIDADAGMEGQAIMSLGTPSRHPMACRLGADGRTLMAVCAIPSETEDGGRLAFGLSGHPCISGFALDMPLGHVPQTGMELILDTDSLVARLTVLLDAVSTTTDLLLAGRRNEAIARRREAGNTATSARTVIGGHWMDRGSLDGPLAMVIAMVCPSTPWSRAAMYTTQAVSPHTMPPAGTMGIQPRTGISLLDEEGLAILDAAMHPCVEIDWSPDVKTPDGHEIRRMHVGPPSFTGMISKSSQPDAMEMLRAHRMVPIPEHCVTRLGS
jgi:hypothetical protein